MQTLSQKLITKHKLHIGYSHFIHLKTIATEVEIQFLSTWIMFPSLLPQLRSAFFSSKEGGVQVFLSM